MKKLLTILLLLGLTIGANASQLLIQAPFGSYPAADLAEGSLYTYDAGTTDEKATYKTTDVVAATGTAHTNPIVLNSDGHSDDPIYFEGVLKYVLKDSSGNTIDTIDNYYGMGSTPPDGVNLSDYADIAAAITAIGATATTLWLDDAGTQSMDENVTIPATLSVIAMEGCVITTTGYTLAINSKNFQAGDHQVFAGTGTITGLKHVNPHWWGVSEAASAATNDTAFTQSIKALEDDSSYTLPGGAYNTSQVITFTSLSRVDINFLGRIIPDDCDGIKFDAIDTSNISVKAIINGAVDWTETNAGIIVSCATGANGRNSYHFGHISNMYQGILIDADTNGIAYNNYDFRSIYNAKYGIYFEQTGTGWSNENSYYGGEFVLTAGQLALDDDDYGIYFETGGDWNNHRFYDCSFEGLSNGIRFININNVLLSLPRFEGVAARAGEYWIDCTGGAVGHLTWILGQVDFDASKLNLNISRNFTFIGAGQEDSDYQTIITDNSYGGLSWATEKNMEQSHADLSSSHAIGTMYLDDYWDERLTYNKSYQGSVPPATGTYRENAVVWNTSTGAGGSMFWLCTAAGTMDTNPGITVTGAAGQKVLAVASGDVDKLFAGQYINIVGEAGTYEQINWVNYDDDEFTIYTNLGSSPSGAALTFHDATWTLGPSAGGWTALTDGPTPSVLYLEKVSTGGTTTITDFINGYIGQELKIYASHSVTITDGTNIFLSGSANWAMTATDMLHLIYRTNEKWYEVGRSDNGA